MTTYDVFLSHASADKPSVETLARRLREDGLEPFLDKWHLVPGEPWQEALEDALEASRTCAVFVGRKLGPWQNEEMRAALDERVRDTDYRVIPVLLPATLKPGEKGLPRFLRRLTWVDFRRGLDDDDAYHRLVCGIRGVAPDAGAAPPTQHPQLYRSMAPASDQFVHRRELDAVRDLLVDAAGGTVGITTALRGAGGFGKTALAHALCEDPAVRQAYPDGILWAQMRDDMRDADRLAVVQDLIRFRHEDEKQSFETLPAASARLREVLDGEGVLLVVDDVWRFADVEPFRGLGAGSAVLVTTRDSRTLPADCRRVDVDAMERSEAVTLLTSDLSVDGGEGLDGLAKRLGEWPLLLRLVNRQLRELMGDEGLGLTETLRAVEEELDESGVTAFDVDDETARDQAVERTLGVSLRRLAYDERQRFRELAVFPEDVDVPLGVLNRFWGLPVGKVRKLCKRLHDLSLLLRFERAARTIRLHDVVRQYLVGEHGDLPALHRRLLERCCPSSGHWTDLADGEVYLWRHLAGHLVGAAERAELWRLLFDLDYLERKLRAVGVNALLADYDGLGEAGEPRTVQEALRLSAHVLVRDWGEFLGQQLAGQLLGRLEPGGEEGRRLLRRAAERALLYPRRVRMSRTGGPLIRILEGHTGGVNTIVVLDETNVVSASDDGTLRVWDVASGETVRTFKGHTDQINAVALLGEMRMVSASHDRTLRLWDLATGETIRTFEGHTSFVNTVAVLDEARVVSASSDHTLRVWNVATGETIHILEGHTRTVNAVTVLDEMCVVSASSDHTLRVWNLLLGETIRTLEGHTSGVFAVAVLDERRVVSASYDSTLRVWDVALTKTLCTLEGHTSGVRTVAVLDETHVISASDDQTLRMWNVATGKTIRTLEGHTSWVRTVAVLDETHVVSGSQDSTLHVWDLASANPIRSLEGHTSMISAMMVLDEARVVSASYDHTLRVWDISSGETISTLEGHTEVVNAVAVLDETRVVSASSDRTLRVWNVASGQAIRTLIGHTDWVLAVAALDETHVVSESQDEPLRVWDVVSGKTIRTLEGNLLRVQGMAVLNETLLISAVNRILYSFDVASGETIRVFKGHTGEVNAVAVLDETRVVSASSDRTLRIWDVASGESMRTFTGHTSQVNAVTVLDEKRVVSASWDRTLRVWDVVSGDTMAVFALDAPLSAVAVTADGQTVVAGDRTGGVHFLDLDLP